MYIGKAESDNIKQHSGKMLPPEAMGGAGVTGRGAPGQVGVGGGPLKT